jgi:hypothetical protein
VHHDDLQLTGQSLPRPISTTKQSDDMLAFTLAVPLLAGLCLAAPTSPKPASTLTKKDLHIRQLADWTQNITIHESCNATEVRRLNKALAETFEVAEAARDCEWLRCRR